MTNLTDHRFAVFAIGRGGRIFAEKSFGEAENALPELTRMADSCREAERIVMVDRRDGRRIAERPGQANPEPHT